MLGGVRVPVSGRIRGDNPDIEHEWLSLEVKHRKSLPNWLHDAMDQAKKSKKSHQQLPMVVLHQKNQRFDDSFCVISLKDWTDWFGGMNNEKTTTDIDSEHF